MRLLLCAALVLAPVLGCKGQAGTPRVAVDPVSADDAQKFATQFAEAAIDCDEAKLAPLVDADAMAAKYAAQSTLPDAKAIAPKLATSTAGARILCAWLRGVAEYKVLRIKTVAGQPHPILRRTISDKAGATIVAYDELQLGTTRRDRRVRLVDAFSYAQGHWVSQLVGGNLDASAPLDLLGDLPAGADQVHEARELVRQGKQADALAILDALPVNVRGRRSVMMLRVRAAAGTSPEAYTQALAELAKAFPDDPGIAMTQIDGAMVRGDHETALRWIDILDRALGGDAYQMSNRALVLHSLGRLDEALAQANRAIELEPALIRAHEVKLDILVAQKKWADAIAVMTLLESEHGVSFDEAKLRASPAMAELIASQDFKDWLAKRK